VTMASHSRLCISWKWASIRPRITWVFSTPPADSLLRIASAKAINMAIATNANIHVNPADTARWDYGLFDAGGLFQNCPAFTATGGL
jgi:hypothetical protein